jgi:hypothetical protein
MCDRVGERERERERERESFPFPTKKEKLTQREFVDRRGNDFSFLFL